jgi:predicted CXXCH cytochrome family protein
VCAKCHVDQSSLAGGPHDWHRAEAAATIEAAASWPEASAATGDRCLACHRPHGDETHGLNRVPPAKGEPSHEAACIACHPGAARHAAGDMAALHPRLVPADAVSHNVPTFEAERADLRTIACLTCHNPHAGGGTPSLVRVPPDQPAAQVCSECHKDVAPIALTAHAPDRLLAAGFDAHTCTPCHAVHGDPNKVDPRFLTSVPESVGDATVAAMPPSNRMCLSCHREGGAAPRPAVWDHPQVPMRAIGEAADQSGLPLFDGTGQPSAEGRIGCPTCHVPHGHTMDAAEMARLAALSPAERRATRLLLRPFQPPNVCTTCHGADALRRFLYYHDIERRGGMLLNPSALRGFGAMPNGMTGG